MSPGPIDPSELRVSDAEREHVVAILQKAIGRGLLDLDEFTARTDRALASRTRGQLNSLLIDLPGVVNREAGAPTLGPSVALNARMTDVRRAGRWEVPRELVIDNQMGTVELDFTEAIVPHREVSVRLEVFGGGVSLRLPASASCDVEELAGSAGGAVEHHGVRPAGGSPHFAVTGRVRGGSLVITQASTGL